jgi:hypothetical protein
MAVLAPALKHGQRLPLQSVAGAGDRYFFWRGMVVGSLSKGRSIESTTIALWPASHRGYPIHACSNLSGHFSMPG